MNTNGSRVGIALGGGGVRGLGHVPSLETIDACGIEPAVIAGTSMGAVIGVLYATGMSGKDIRGFVERHIVMRNDTIKSLYAKRAFLLKWLKSVRLSWRRAGLLQADGFLRYLMEQIDAETFEELRVPLRIVATDFHSGQPVVFDSGRLFPALKASMSIPGVLVPVQHEGRILVDGGVSNNLPYDILVDECDVTIAVDVLPARREANSRSLDTVDAMLGMFDIFSNGITRAMIEKQPPDIYFNPQLVGIRILEFDKAEEVFRQTEAAIPKLKGKLEAL